MAWQDYYNDDEIIGSSIYYGPIYLAIRKSDDKWQILSPSPTKLNSETVEDAKLEARIALKALFYEAYKAMDTEDQENKQIGV
jgi:hypothetical protein